MITFTGQQNTSGIPNVYQMFQQQQMQQQQYQPQMMQQPMQQQYQMYQQPMNNIGYNPNNVQYQQPYGYGGIPPIGNMMQLTGNGMMNGYFNPGNGYGYVNPYMMQQLKEQEDAMRRENLRNQSNLIKRISASILRNDNTSQDIIDNHIKMYDPIIEVPKRTEEDVMYERGLYLQMNTLDTQYLTPSLFSVVNNRQLEVQKIIPVDISFEDYLDRSHLLLEFHAVQEAKARKQNLGTLYDKQAFGKLLDIHKNNNSYFSSMFANKNKPINIDDQEIKLPSHIAQSYTERKQSFINKLMKGS